MRLLYISNYYKPAYSYGGPTTASARLCEALVQLGVQVTVLTTNANGAHKIAAPVGVATDVAGVTVYYYPLKLGGLGFFYSPELAKAVNQHLQCADFVILQGGWGYIVQQAGEAILKAGKPYSIPLHGQLLGWAYAQKHFKKKLFFQFILRKYLQHAAFIQCTSDLEADGVVSLGVSTPKVVLPYGVKIPDYEPLPPRGYFREKYQIPGDAAILLYLGRLHPNKGPDIAISAMDGFQNSPVHLILAGSDEAGMLPGLIGYADELGLANQIHYAGLLDESEIRCAFSDAEILIVPSRVNENFGMTAIESMAAGVPVVVSSGISYGGVIEEYGAGRQVETTAAAFRNTVREMLADKESLLKMSRNGKSLVRDHFDINKIAKELLNGIDSTISAHPV